MGIQRSKQAVDCTVCSNPMSPAMSGFAIIKFNRDGLNKIHNELDKRLMNADYDEHGNEFATRTRLSHDKRFVYEVMRKYDRLNTPRGRRRGFRYDSNIVEGFGRTKDSYFAFGAVNNFVLCLHCMHKTGFTSALSLRNGDAIEWVFGLYFGQVGPQLRGMGIFAPPGLYETLGRVMFHSAESPFVIEILQRSGIDAEYVPITDDRVIADFNGQGHTDSLSILRFKQ